MSGHMEEMEGEDRLAMRPQESLFPLGNLARDIDPIIGHRLAAFADGEGCFYISARQGSSGFYFCSFIIQLRIDDLPILERFREGCGGVGGFQYQQHRSGWAPAVAWRVGKKAEVSFIRDLFELYPLWSKKARDFAVWSRAVDFWQSVDPGQRYTDWSPMVAMRDELRAARELQVPEVLA